MDDMDDFGDLYGDLGFQVRDYSNEKDVEGEKIKSNPIEADLAAKEIAKFERENDNNNDNITFNSESDDDDFHIVLNENECRKFEKSKVGLDGFDEEGEFEDSLNNEQLPTKGADELVQGNEVRGRHFSRHTQSQLQRFHGSVGGLGSGSGAWDNPVMPCDNRNICTASYPGVPFCLARNRTIFDVNMEAFEQKPWRLHGADMTDYFNFGLDEESWKSYQESLNHFKKQAMMPDRFPVYQSSMLNQGERCCSVQETLEKGVRVFDLPKGRAIQVEGGLGERLPSMDIRRPRILDSDVVIQINMEGSVEDVSASCKNSLEHRGEHTDASGNNSNEEILSSRHDGQMSGDITKSVEHYPPELNGSNFKVTSGKVNVKADCKKDKGFDSSNQVPHCCSSHNLQRHSEKSDDAFSVAKDIRPIRKSYIKESQGSIESDNYLSHDSISDATESEKEETKNDVCEPDASSGEHKHLSRRLKSVAELYVSKDDALTSRLNHWKHQDDLDLVNQRCKTRKRKSSYHIETEGHLYLYDETEMSRNCKGRTHVAKHGSKKSCTEDLRKCDRLTHRTRNWVDEDCLKERGYFFSERQYEDLGGKSSFRKCSDQTISRSKSFQERDSYLRLERGREDEYWIRMEHECDDIMRDHRHRESGIRNMHGKHKYFCDMEEEIYDFKLRRHVYPADRDIRSPERSRCDKRLIFAEGPSKYFAGDDDAYHKLANHSYETPYNLDERDWHASLLPRECLRMSLGSKRGFMDHGGCLNNRDLQFKNKRNSCVDPSIKDRHCLLYKDNLEHDIDGYISEGNVHCRNIVSSIQMRRCNRLSKPNIHSDAGARFMHHERNNLPALERDLLKRSSKHDNFHVNKPSFIRQRLHSCHLLNNSRKITVDGMSDADAIGKHELATVVSREALNKHLNGFKGKLARRCSGGLGESKTVIGTGYKLDKQPKNFKHPRVICKQEEIPNGESSHSYQTGLKVDKSKDPKSLNKLPVSQNVEGNEIEEGELIEGLEKQDIVPGKKDWISVKRIENFISKDSSRSVKIAGIYDSNHILKTIAKMEKRKERFKEPIAPKPEPEKAVNPQQDVSVLTDGAKEQRPVRKRRWGGN